MFDARPMRTLAVGALCGLLTVLGCSAAGRSADSGRFQREVAVATERDIAEKVPPVLIRYQYEIFQHQEEPGQTWITRWRARHPYPDEQERGVQAAETRLQIRSRPRATASGLGEIYTVDLIVENRVRMLGSEQWEQAALSDSAEEYAQELAAEFKRVLDVGVRVYGTPPCCAP